MIRLTSLIFLACIVAFLGCSTSSLKSENGGPIAEVIRGSGNGSEEDASVTPEKESGSRPLVQVQNFPIDVWGQRLKVFRFDYPVVVNPTVEKWISYFQGKGRRYFEKYLERGQYFIPEISKVLKTHNMPQDLVYLAMIESGFNNSAKSRARAVGPWQFIRATGVRYGLSVNYWIDERRETKKATMAAIRYLRELYLEFGSWELAAAAYNAGEGKVRRAIAKYKTKDFWEIARHRFFKRETRDYVPKIMAAAILTKNTDQFGFVSPFAPGSQTQHVALASIEEPTPKELGEDGAKADDTSDDPAEALSMLSENDDEMIADDTDPEGEDEGHAVALNGAPGGVLTSSVYRVLNPNEQIIEFSVKGPADLFAISKAAGLPYSSLKLLNPELLRWCTPPYLKTYRIKLPLSVKDRFLSTYNNESFERKVVFSRYTVRRGDDVRTVARRFGVEADPIREINNMAPKAIGLATGKIIMLPLPTGYKRVIAGMYDDKPMPERRRRYRRVRKNRRHNRVENGISHRTSRSKNES